MEGSLLTTPLGSLEGPDGGDRRPFALLSLAVPTHPGRHLGGILANVCRLALGPVYDVQPAMWRALEEVGRNAGVDPCDDFDDLTWSLCAQGDGDLFVRHCAVVAY